MLTPADQDVLDLEQAFVTVTEPVGDGTARVRLGRQQMNFDFQRFVSDRDGPNVRQSFDAAWGEYEEWAWKFITFYSQPVQIYDFGAQPFDGYSSGANTFSVVRAQRELFGWATLSAYYAYLRAQITRSTWPSAETSVETALTCVCTPRPAASTAISKS